MFKKIKNGIMNINLGAGKFIFILIIAFATCFGSIIVSKMLKKQQASIDVDGRQTKIDSNVNALTSGKVAQFYSSDWETITPSTTGGSVENFAESSWSGGSGENNLGVITFSFSSGDSSSWSYSSSSWNSSWTRLVATASSDAYAFVGYYNSNSSSVTSISSLTKITESTTLNVNSTVPQYQYIYAIFKLSGYDLTILSANTATGKVKNKLDGNLVSSFNVGVPKGCSFSSNANNWMTQDKNYINAFAIANTGYEFSYWSKSSGYVNSNMTIISYFVASTYTITFDNQSADIVTGTTTITATYNSDLQNITIPQKTGYTFSGYYTQTNGQGQQYYDASGKGTKKCDFTIDSTFYANWIVNIYTITLNNQSATNSGSLQIYQKYGVGYFIDSICSQQMNQNQHGIHLPTKQNLSFDGYYTSINNGIQLINKNGFLTTNANSSQYTANDTLYAYWIDSILPTANITYEVSSNCKKLKGTGQDNVGIVGYSFTQDANNIPTFTKIDLSSSIEEIFEPNISGDWFFCVEDSSGNFTRSLAIAVYNVKIIYDSNCQIENSQSLAVAGTTYSNKITAKNGYSIQCSSKNGVDCTFESATSYSFEYFLTNLTVKDAPNDITFSKSVSLVQSGINVKSDISFSAISSTSNVTLTILANKNYNLPQKIDVNNAIANYDNQSGHLELSNIIGSIRITAIGDAKVYKITLQNDNSNDNDNSQIFEKYNIGFYLDYECTMKMSFNSNYITPPKKIGYSFENYIFEEEDGTETEYITKTGYIKNTVDNQKFEA